jgi:hypothetical protein
MEPPTQTQLLRSESGQGQDINIGSPKERQVLQLIVRTFPQAGEAAPPALTHDVMGHVTIAVGSAAGNGAGDRSMDSGARALRAPVTRSAQCVRVTACRREAFPHARQRTQSNSH